MVLQEGHRFILAAQTLLKILISKSPNSTRSLHHHQRAFAAESGMERTLVHAKLKELVKELSELSCCYQEGTSYKS